MKKKSLLLIIGIVLTGAVSYFAGYFFMYEKPKMEIIEPISLQRTLLLSDENDRMKYSEYYVAKIEKRMLNIYRMPENIIYDSIKLSSLQFSKEEYEKLLEGITLGTLTEVFEFLENSMS